MFNVIIADGSERSIREIKALNFWERNVQVFTIKCTATDGAKVIGLLDDKDIDIIIADVQMEEPNGFDILRAVEEKGRCICVILTGTKEDYHIVKKALTHYAFDYLVKPVSDKALSESLERALKRFEKKRLKRSMSDVDLMCSDIVDRMINGGADLDDTLDELIKKCVGSGNGYISNIQKLRTAAEKIYKEICITYEWIFDLIPEPSVILKNTTVSDDSEYADMFLDYITEISRTINKYYPYGINGATKAAIDYVLQNRFCKLTLSDAAQKCFVNKAHLSHIFKQNTGISFTEYVSNLKMQMLRKMVISSSMQLTEIADILGYDDYKYMGRIFKSTYGVTPTEFRNDPDIG